MNSVVFNFKKKGIEENEKRWKNDWLGFFGKDRFDPGIGMDG